MHKELHQSAPFGTGPAAPPGGEVFVMPCSVSQKRYWLLNQISPGSTALVIPIAVQLSGPLDLEILEKSLNAIVRRHEILRTHFAAVDGGPKQIIASEVTLTLHRSGLGDVPPEKHQAEIARIMSEEALRPVPMTEAPVMRATLVRLAPQEHVLMLSAQHIISDGWSNGVLVRELAHFYEAFLNGRASDLPPLAIQYADYALWQEEWLKTPAYEGQLDYWRQELAGELPVLDFPTDFARRPGQAEQALLESLLLPASLTESLKQLCREGGITLFMVFFSAYVVLLHRYTGQARLMVGTTSANRNRPELEAMVGIFANLILLRSDVSGQTTFREFLLRQRDRLLGAFANHEAPFERILEDLQARPSGVPKTLLQTHFLFQKAFMQPTACGELAIKPLYSVSPGSTFELAYGIVERAEGIRLQMEYRTGLFRRSTTRRLLLHFEALLAAVAAHPDTPIEELPLFATGEREQIEAAWPAARTGLAKSPAAIFDDFDRQLEDHFRRETAPFVPARLPEGAMLAALDGELRLLPVGIPGELYLGHPDLAAAPGAVTGPADAEVPWPLLKTGFLGRHGEDGSVELWGRAEDIVPLPVFRANRRAVEIRLRSHPAVAEAAVIVQPQFVAYAVLKPGARTTENELRVFLRGGVAEPSAVVILEALPKDTDGKIVAEKLPAPVAKTTGGAPLQGILHQQLAEIWRDILKVPDLGLDDNFFECGGNSFLALRMMMRAEKLCRRPLPLSLLLTGATISNLARFIIETNAESEAAMELVPVQPKGTRPPLFFLHGDWVGGGFYCTRLSQQLGEEQPFFALPPYHFREDEPLDLREMAARQRAAIEKQWPQGPYFVGGYCIGALVAMEMARQWTAQGKTVAHLFLVEPPVWATPWLRSAWRVVDRLGDLRGWDLEKKIDVFDRYPVVLNRRMKRPLSSHLRRIFGRPAPAATAVPAAPAEAGFDADEMLKGIDYARYFLAYRLHKLQPLSVPATIFVSESTPPERVSGLARALRMDPAKYRIERVPGDHTTCVTKDISVLVEKIRVVLETQ